MHNYLFYSLTLRYFSYLFEKYSVVGFKNILERLHFALPIPRRKYKMGVTNGIEFYKDEPKSNE